MAGERFPFSERAAWERKFQMQREHAFVAPFEFPNHVDFNKIIRGAIQEGLWLVLRFCSLEFSGAFPSPRN